jgi:Na+/H+ antiporter NhaC
MAGLRHIYRKPLFMNRRRLPTLLRPSIIFFLIAVGVAVWVGRTVTPTVVVGRIPLEAVQSEDGQTVVRTVAGEIGLESFVPLDESFLNPDSIEILNREGGMPEAAEQLVVETFQVDGVTEQVYSKLVVKRHWGVWSLLPVITAIGLCWITREPLFSLFAGIVAGAAILGWYDLTERVLLPSFSTPAAAGVLLLYLWLLGGLLGIWNRTGAAQAFAELMTRRFVRGPKTAKLVAWGLGVVFFQGGSISTVLVGTTVKPIADQENVSHEELSYIVDSTASPIACLLALNAWPGYIQSFLFVAGVPWLATESGRLKFFFASIPLSFYAIFAVIFTLLLSLGWSPFIGKRMKEAIRRARETGQLDAPGARPLASKELETSHVPEGYQPHVIDFFLPLFTLLGFAVGTFFFFGMPEIRGAFALAMVVAFALAMVRGMELSDLMIGIFEGMKGVIPGCTILLMAIAIGFVSQEVGNAVYIVELMGNQIPFWALPVILELLTIVIAFSTGTSWGTYAVVFPLAMPFAWMVATTGGMVHPELYMGICFAAVLNGSAAGDQCSPISDTTILSAMCTGCDLMDHVRTQLPQASIAAALAGIGWTAMTLICC